MKESQREAGRGGGMFLCFSNSGVRQRKRDGGVFFFCRGEGEGGREGMGTCDVIWSFVNL